MSEDLVHTQVLPYVSTYVSHKSRKFDLYFDGKCQSPFAKTGAMFAFPHSSDGSPMSINCWKIVASTRANSGTSSCRTRFGAFGPEDMDIVPTAGAFSPWLARV